MTSPLDRVVPYVEQLPDNDDVQKNVKRSAARARQAYGGVRSQKSKTKALEDGRVWRRAGESITSARAAVVAVRRGRDEERKKQTRRRRRRTLLLLVVASAGALLAWNEDLRNQVLGLVGGNAEPGGQPDDSGAASNSDSAAPATPVESSGSLT